MLSALGLVFVQRWHEGGVGNFSPTRQRAATAWAQSGSGGEIARRCVHVYHRIVMMHYLAGVAEGVHGTAYCWLLRTKSCHYYQPNRGMFA